MINGLRDGSLAVVGAYYGVAVSLQDGPDKTLYTLVVIYDKNARRILAHWIRFPPES
jgi:hypothetical protein